MNLKEFARLSKSAFHEWRAHNMISRAASLTFFIILPLPPLLLIVTAILAQIYGEPGALQQLINQITTVAGPTVAQLFRQLLESSTNPFPSIFASVIGVGFTIAGAIGAFAVLHDTMNLVWGVSPPKQRSLATRVRHKIGPFLLVSGLGIAAIIWTAISALVFSFINLIFEPSGNLLVLILIGILHVVLSFALAVFLFAVIYKQLADISIEWRDITPAAVLIGLIFTATNYLFEVYIQIFIVNSVAGAAGALMVLLIWVFTINQLLLFGAEFCKIYATRFGSFSKKNDLKKSGKTGNSEMLT